MCHCRAVQLNSLSDSLQHPGGSVPGPVRKMNGFRCEGHEDQQQLLAGTAPQSALSTLASPLITTCCDIFTLKHLSAVLWKQLASKCNSCQACACHVLLEPFSCRGSVLILPSYWRSTASRPLWIPNQSINCLYSFCCFDETAVTVDCCVILPEPTRLIPILEGQKTPLCAPFSPQAFSPAYTCYLFRVTGLCFVYIHFK